MQTGTIDSPEKIHNKQPINVTPSPPPRTTNQYNFTGRKKPKNKYTHKRRNEQKYGYVKKRKFTINSTTPLCNELSDEEVDEEEVSYGDMVLAEENSNLFDGQNVLRLVIAYYYRCCMKAPPESEWEEHVYDHICSTF